MRTDTYDETKWRLVPVEPTSEQKDVGNNVGWWCGDIYRAMINVVTTTPDTGAGDAVQARTDGFRDCIDAIRGAIAFGQQDTNRPPDGHWLAEFWQIGASLSAMGAGDAARYRWLRDRILGVDFDWNESGITALSFSMPNGCAYGSDCDQNIDAAMRASKGEA